MQEGDSMAVDPTESDGFWFDDDGDDDDGTTTPSPGTMDLVKAAHDLQIHHDLSLIFMNAQQHLHEASNTHVKHPWIFGVRR